MDSDFIFASDFTGYVYWFLFLLLRLTWLCYLGLRICLYEMPKKSVLKCYFGCVVDGPLHRFPKWVYPHEERFKIWKTVLKQETQDKSNEYVFNNIRLCYRHFEGYYQLPSHLLTRNAVPTLNLSLPDLSRNVMIHGSASTSTGSTSELALVPAVIPPTLTGSLCIKKVPRKTLQSQPSSKAKGYIRKMCKLKERILRLQNKCRSQSKRIHMAEKLSKSKIFLETLETLPEPAKIFTNLQLKHKRKLRGRIYTLKEKILSLTILKQSPKAYNLLRKLFVLPSKRTLQKLLSSLVITPGINPHILNYLKKSATKLSDEKKLCSLLFDEVALSPGVYYNKHFKEIIGFEDFGYKKTTKIADHALVFMLKSIKGKFKQPICFTFCQGATKKDDLKNIIKEVIKGVKDTGLKIICTVCDQSTTNVSTIKSLNEDSKEVYLKRGKEYKSLAFEVNDLKIFALIDPPHLLKGIRNNLLTKNLRYIENGTVKIAKWEHILLFMEKDDEENELRLVNKITELHYKNDKIPKMKVKYAAQVFSQRLSAAMKFCIRHEILHKDCSDTADLLLMFDKLFDSFNGHLYRDSEKKYRGCLKNGSNHFKLWEELLPILRLMGFEIKMKDGTKYYKKVPSIINFIHNINTYKEMWTYLNQKHKVSNLLTRNINQDPLENFFCKIRSNGVRNTNPTCQQFINIYKTLIINNFATPHSVNANCEDDNCFLLNSLEHFLEEETCTKDVMLTESIQIDALLTELETPTQYSQNSKYLIHNETKKYVAGWVLKKAKTKIFKNCPVCTQLLTANEKKESSYIYDRDVTKRSLIYPSDKFNCFMKDVFQIIERCIQESSVSQQLFNNIIFNVDIYTECNMMSCDMHTSCLKTFIISLATVFILHSWCAEVNKILKGKISRFNINDKIKEQAYNYYKKHSKYKKKNENFVFYFIISVLFSIKSYQELHLVISMYLKY